MNKNIISNFSADYKKSPDDLKIAFNASVAALGFEIIGGLLGISGIFFILFPAMSLLNVLPYANRKYRDGGIKKTK
ncbi:MAG: hypothetical protein ACD_12C00877G0004 [uncultured bacterium]|nr:MAG: hypothetical protein ACD_12C00877G0004 [uncultured bacterium]